LFLLAAIPVFVLAEGVPVGGNVDIFASKNAGFYADGNASVSVSEKFDALNVSASRNIDVFCICKCRYLAEY